MPQKRPRSAKEPNYLGFTSAYVKSREKPKFSTSELVRMRDLFRRAERYHRLAHKYRDLAKVAEPPYLGDFYRGVAVRYVFMAQEVSRRAERQIGSNGHTSSLPEYAGNGEGAEREGEGPRREFDMLAVWAESK